MKFDDIHWQERMYSLSNDFFHAASLYAQVIISELTLPVSLKSIQPVKIGGIAGGDKYIVDNILFKLAVDRSFDQFLSNGKQKKVYMYGGNKQRHDLSMKAAGIEMSNMQIVLAARPDPLYVPLMCIIDYLGHRMIASSILPINKYTLAYGSSDGGDSVYNSIPELNDIMAVLGKRLNLQEHHVYSSNHHKNILLHTPGDIEVHRGLDGSYYIIDCARLMPPEAPFFNPVPTSAFKRSSKNIPSSPASGRLTTPSISPNTSTDHFTNFLSPRSLNHSPHPSPFPSPSPYHLPAKRDEDFNSPSELPSLGAYIPAEQDDLSSPVSSSSMLGPYISPEEEDHLVESGNQAIPLGPYISAESDSDLPITSSAETPVLGPYISPDGENESSSVIVGGSNGSIPHSSTGSSSFSSSIQSLHSNLSSQSLDSMKSSTNSFNQSSSPAETPSTPRTNVSSTISSGEANPLEETKKRERENKAAVDEDLSNGRTIYYQMLRPELVNGYKEPLSSDAFSGWSENDKNKEKYNSAIKKCTEFLHYQIIPSFADKLQKNHLESIGPLPENKKQWEELPQQAIIGILDASDLSSTVHYYGINVRHIGRIRSLLTVDSYRCFLLINILARTMKNILRNDMRVLMSKSLGSPSDIPFRDLVLSTYRKIVPPCTDASNLISSFVPTTSPCGSVLPPSTNPSPSFPSAFVNEEESNGSNVDTIFEKSNEYWQNLYNQVNHLYKYSFSDEEHRLIKEKGLREFVNERIDLRTILYLFFKFSQVRLSSTAFNQLLASPYSYTSTNYSFLSSKNPLKSIIPSPVAMQSSTPYLPSPSLPSFLHDSSSTDPSSNSPPLSPSAASSDSSDSISSSSPLNNFVLVRADVESFTPRTRRPYISSLATSLLLINEAKQSSGNENVLRLLELATQKMYAAHIATPICSYVNEHLGNLYIQKSYLYKDKGEAIISRLRAIKYLEMSLSVSPSETLHQQLLDLFDETEKLCTDYPCFLPYLTKLKHKKLDKALTKCCNAKLAAAASFFDNVSP